MNVLLLQLDGTGANLALMRIAAHHRAAGDRVELRRAFTPGAVERMLGDTFDRVYASLIFERTRPIAERMRKVYPDATVGGSGWDLTTTLEDVGIPTRGPVDYSDYPAHRESIGFTQRGCRLKCKFCQVPVKEGRPVEWDAIADIWRGDPWPRHILLLDNDFFGVPSWPARIEELKAGKFKVSFNQGINARMLTDEACAAIASVNYQSRKFDCKRLYTAWDNLKDEAILFKGLESLARHGVRPDDITVYMLIGYDHKAKVAISHLTPDDFRRQARLREFGCRPYPMPFVRPRELTGFQRWIVGAYDKRVAWPDWVAAGYDPRRLGTTEDYPLLEREFRA